MTAFLTPVQILIRFRDCLLHLFQLRQQLLTDRKADMRQAVGRQAGGSGDGKLLLLRTNIRLTFGCRCSRPKLLRIHVQSHPQKRHSLRHASNSLERHVLWPHSHRILISRGRETSLSTSHSANVPLSVQTEGTQVLEQKEEISATHLN